MCKERTSYHHFYLEIRKGRFKRTQIGDNRNIEFTYILGSNQSIIIVVNEAGSYQMGGVKM